MAEEGYLIPQFHFEVTWAGVSINCSEVSGLSDDINVIEGRDGKSDSFYPVKRPGIHDSGTFTLKNAIFKSTDDFKSWFDRIATRDTNGYRETMSIVLKDENHNPAHVWNVKNAWIIKYDMPELNSQTNEPAIQSIELCSG